MSARDRDRAVLRAVLHGVGVPTGRLEHASPAQREIAGARLRGQANACDHMAGAAGYADRRLRLAALVERGMDSPDARATALDAARAAEARERAAYARRRRDE